MINSGSFWATQLRASVAYSEQAVGEFPRFETRCAGDPLEFAVNGQAVILTIADAHMSICCLNRER